MGNTVTLPDGRTFSFPTPEAADEFRRRAGLDTQQPQQRQPSFQQQPQQPQQQSGSFQSGGFQSPTQQRIQQLEGEVGTEQGGGGIGQTIKGFAKELIRPFAKTAVSGQRAAQGVLGLGKSILQGGTGTEQGRQTIMETGALMKQPETIFGVEETAAQTMTQALGTGIEVGSWIPGVGAAGASLKLQALAGMKFGAMVGGMGELGRALQEEDVTGREILERTAWGTGIGAGIGAAFPVVAKGTRTLTKGILGQATGLGSRNISALYKTFAYGTKEEVKLATKALRGKTEEMFGPLLEDIVNGVNQIRFKRSSEYQAQLAKLKGIPEKVDLKPLSETVDGLLKKFNITKTNKGELDFSRSTLAKTEENEIIDMLNDVLSWGSKADDNTVLGLDILKQKIDGYFSRSSKVNYFATNVKKQITKQLDEVTSGAYSKMKKGYEEATNLAGEIERSLSLNSKNLDTTFKKINSILRDNQEYRAKLLQDIEEYIGRDVTGEIAAGQASSWFPRGLAKFGAGAFGTGGVTGVISPQFLPLLAASSPRLVGEWVRVMGLSNRMIQALVTKMVKSGVGVKNAVIKELQKIMENQGGYMRLPGASNNPMRDSLKAKMQDYMKQKAATTDKNQIKNIEKLMNDVQAQIDKIDGLPPKGNGATSPKTVGEDLLQEAKKYKSADEFVNAQTNAYHGTQETFDIFDNVKRGSATDSGMFGRGFYFTEDIAEATKYTRGKGTVKEVYLDLKNPYVINKKSDIPKIETPTETLDDLRKSADNYSDLFTEYLQKRGYDGVIDKLNGKTNQIVVFDAKNIKTKSQLTDIWNKANTKTVGGVDELKAYKTIQELNKDQNYQQLKTQADELQQLAKENNSGTQLREWRKLQNELDDIQDSVYKNQDKFRETAQLEKDLLLRKSDNTIDALSATDNTFLLNEAKKYQTFDEFQQAMRGSATQYGEYNPKLRRYLSPDSKRLSEIPGFEDDVIKVYRGIDTPSGAGKIGTGDFVTMDFNDAAGYTSDPSKVVSLDVKTKNLITEYPDEIVPGEDIYELIYYPKDDFVKITDTKLKEIWNKAQ